MSAEARRFGEFELDPGAYQLRRGGVAVRLERILLELLCLLVDRAGQLVTREEILERVWGKGVFVDSETSINTAIRKIRRVLDDPADTPRFILTVPAKGYRFVAPVFSSNGEINAHQEFHHPAPPTNDLAHTPELPNGNYWRIPAWGLFLAGLAIVVASVFAIQHLSLNPQRTHASMQIHPQAIGFCKTIDGKRIAYATTGAGPAVVMLMGWLTNLETGFLSPLYAGPIIDELSAHHLLIRYDGRGFGLSDRGISDYSLDARLRDLDAVVSALGLRRFALFGISSGAQTAIAYAARHPDRVSRLVLYGSIAKPPPLSAQDLTNYRAFLIVVRLSWGSDNSAFRQIFTNTLMPDGNDHDVRVFNEMERVAATGEDAAAFMAANATIDVAAAASQIRVPTLVVHRRGDLMVPFRFGREVAALIPRARLLAVDGRDHLFLPDDPGNSQIAYATTQFLDADLSK